MALIKVNNRGQSADFSTEIGATKNLIINGGFDVWQRGTSFSNVNDVYTADRMYVVSGGGTTGDNVTRQAFTVGQTDVPGEPTYYFRFTAGSTSSNKVVHHRIEDVRTGAGQTVTLSFWGKASTAHNSTIELGQNFGSGGSSQVVPSSQSYSLTTSWQKFTFNIVLPSISGKTIGTSSYLYIAFIRSLPASNVDIDIAQMQLEIGDTATPFENRSYAEELALCQRYCYFLANLSSGSTGDNMVFLARGNSNSAVRVPLMTAVALRASPTIYNLGGSGYRVKRGDSNTIVGDTTNAMTVQFFSPDSNHLVGNVNISGATDNKVFGLTPLSSTQWYLDSEL